MPTTKEFSIQIADQPGTLGKFCRALADKGVNILAFQSFSSEGKSVVRMVVDNPNAAKNVLGTERQSYTEDEVAQAKLPNWPGELARAASRLGEANINIKYAYTGIEAGSNSALLIFGVVNAPLAASVLDQAAAAART
jgi:hypothetical protein